MRAFTGFAAGWCWLSIYGFHRPIWWWRLSIKFLVFWNSRWTNHVPICLKYISFIYQSENSNLQRQTILLLSTTDTISRPGWRICEIRSQLWQINTSLQVNRQYQTAIIGFNRNQTGSVWWPWRMAALPSPLWAPTTFATTLLVRAAARKIFRPGYASGWTLSRSLSCAQPISL